MLLFSVREKVPGQVLPVHDDTDNQTGTVDQPRYKCTTTQTTLRRVRDFHHKKVSIKDPVYDTYTNPERRLFLRTIKISRLDGRGFRLW